MTPARIQAEGATLHLSGELDFETVVDLEPQGAAWLQEAPVACRIDLSAVTYSSSAGLAMLLAWLRTAGAVGKRPVIVAMPPKMLALAKVGQLTSALPLG